MTIGVALKESQGDVPEGDRFGRVSDLYYDRDAGVFSCVVRQVVKGLAVTTPVQLEAELRTIKVLASTIDGWLFGPEMECLFYEAQAVQSDLAIVEIGSYCGRSTVCLGWGSRLGNRAKVYAVDPHAGSGEHEAYMKGTLGSIPYFRANIERADLEDLVVPLIMTSEEAVAQIPGQVGLIFIDGDHKMAHNDLVMWYDSVVPGGKILFHDSVGGNWPSVETDVQTAVDSGLIQVLEQIGTITVAVKPGEKHEAPE